MTDTITDNNTYIFLGLPEECGAPKIEDFGMVDWVAFRAPNNDIVYCDIDVNWHDYLGDENLIYEESVDTFCDQFNITNDINTDVDTHPILVEWMSKFKQTDQYAGQEHEDDIVVWYIVNHFDGDYNNWLNNRYEMFKDSEMEFCATIHPKLLNATPYPKEVMDQLQQNKLARLRLLVDDIHLVGYKELNDITIVCEYIHNKVLNDYPEHDHHDDYMCDYIQEFFAFEIMDFMVMVDCTKDEVARAVMLGLGKDDSYDWAVFEALDSQWGLVELCYVNDKTLENQDLTIYKSVRSFNNHVYIHHTEDRYPNYVPPIA